jgi:hypothetical protein
MSTMLANIETFLLGFAAVIDTVLLLVLLERGNRPEVPVWLTWSFLGLWLLHVGDFLHSLLADSEGLTAIRLDACCMTMMATGLMLLPTAVLHGRLRVLHTGDQPRPRGDIRYVLVYLPILLVPFVAVHLFSSPGRDFRVSVESYTCVLFSSGMSAFAASSVDAIHSQIQSYAAGDERYGCGLFVCTDNLAR